tara:strand:- start:2879 stop:4300 length:1422 start_codon:yes stop_codon:yes gene_type:complete
MKIKYQIPKPNDTGQFNQTSFLLECADSKKGLFPSLWINYGKEKRYRASALNQFGEKLIRTEKLGIGHTRNMKDDPILTSLSKSISKVLMPPNDTTTNFLNRITFKYIDGDVSILYSRRNKQYFVDLVRMNKKDACVVLAKILLRGGMARSKEIMDEYVDRCVDFPPNILHVIENRTPFTYYYKVPGQSNAPTKIECLINTKLISEKECALEISEGIWGFMPIKDMNTFVNATRLGSRKSERFTDITPYDLWHELFTNAIEDKESAKKSNVIFAGTRFEKETDKMYYVDAQPTLSQYKLMIEWLKQNRTSGMVEDRATELLGNLANEYENIEFIQFRNPTQRALLVSGKCADWIIADEGRGMKLAHQNVNTYKITGNSKSSGWNGYSLSGSICIDNLHNNSSIGDQLSARAMVLMNDKAARDMIYTLRRYITDEEFDGTKKPIRVDRSKVVRWTRAASDAYKQSKIDAKALEK